MKLDSQGYGMPDISLRINEVPAAQGPSTWFEPTRRRVPRWPQAVIGRQSIDLLERVEAIELITGWPRAGLGSSLAVVSANLDHVHRFRADPEWHTRGRGGPGGSSDSLTWVTLLDGAPLVSRTRELTGRNWPKLSGSDLTHPILAAADVRHLRVGFLGGAAETHIAVRQVLGEQLPDLVIAGCWAPERAELTDPGRAARLAIKIADTRVDILFVCLGKPLQEEWMLRWGPESGSLVMLGFGAAVDFLAGRVTRAPQFLIDHGFEWAWRLGQEPRRLASRYLIQGPAALLTVRTQSWLR